MFIFIILAGLPTTVQLDGISLTTTDPAPIFTLSPIIMSPIIQTFEPIFILLPKVGDLPPCPLLPIVVDCRKIRFSPITEFLLIIIAWM